MEACPRCGAKNAFYGETDRWGAYKECFVCSFIQDIGDIPDGVKQIVLGNKMNRVPIHRGEEIG